MVRIFLVCWSVIFLFSCGASSSEKKKEKSSVPVSPVTIDISFSSGFSEVKLSKIAEQIDYVPLETLDSALVGSYFQFQVCDSFLFIEVGGGLYSFKTSGEFVAHFPPVGRGPGEEYVRCFTIDEKNKLIYFIGNYTYKLYAYTFDGKWTRKTFSWLRNDLVTSLFYWDGKLFGISELDPKNDIFSLGIDLSTNKTVFKYPCPYVLPEELQKKRIISLISGVYMIDYQNYKDSLLLYRDMYSDTLWQTSDLLTKSPRYIFNWDRTKKLSYEEYLSYFTSRKRKESEMIMDKLSGKINLIYPLETSRFLFFSATGIYHSLKYGIYDKYSRVVHLYSHGEHGIIENNIDGGPDLTPYPLVRSQWVYKDKLYNLVWPYELLEHESEVSRSAAVEKLYRTVKENDNPILMIVTLKK